MAGPTAASRGAVVITGASTGIGEACALHLDKLGFRVFAGVRKRADGDALKQKSSDRLTPLPIDVTKAGTIASAAATVAAATEDAGIAGLVNNAGIAVAGPLEFLPVDEIRKEFEVNVFGLLAVTQAFLPLVRKGRGRIVNIGSIAGRSALPFAGAYASSKFALEGLTDALRVELMRWDIRVSIVEPGGIATPIWEKSRAKGADIARGLPPQARELYGWAFDAMRTVAEHAARTASPVEMVARAVAHALTAKRPKTRYLVGRDAERRALFQRLPDRLRDRIILNRLRQATGG
jgi:NAD(P)-dependent dehydrogenase (short-subunit alcohol dehydrogenase family)